MQATKREQTGWHVIDDVIAPLAEWWRKHADARSNMADLAALGSGELARIAHDVGCSASDLRAVARHCADAADLLERRLTAIGLDAKELAATEPAQLRDMERLCTMCGAKSRCGRDLAAHPDDPVWQEYCPNHETLAELAGTPAR